MKSDISSSAQPAALRHESRPIRALCRGSGQILGDERTGIQESEPLGIDLLAGYAKDISRNADTFKSCMADGKHLKEIGDEAKCAQ